MKIKYEIKKGVINPVISQRCKLLISDEYIALLHKDFNFIKVYERK